MTFVTFIVPTLGRDTLGRTLNSIVSQKDQDWFALIVADRVREFRLPIVHPRIVPIRLFEKLGQNENGGHCSGFVRNAGIALATSEWIGFVDDDDRIDPHYVECLRRESVGNDLVVFRMRYSPARNDGCKILPRSNRVKDLAACEVGISFAVRREFQRAKDIWFPSEEFEDWLFIQSCLNAGAVCKVSDAVLYYVRH